MTGCNKQAQKEIGKGSEVVSIVSPSGNTETENAEAANYSLVTTHSREEVETFAKEAKEACLSGDWKAIAALCHYPIKIGEVEYKKASALSEAKITLSETFINDLKAETCQNLFTNAQGIMLGNGEVWINENEEGVLQIYAINVMA